MANPPPLEHSVVLLEEISGISHIAVDVLIPELPVDSLDLIEWLYELEDAFALRPTDELLEQSAYLTLADLYRRLCDQAEAELVPSDHLSGTTGP